MPISRGGGDGGLTEEITREARGLPGQTPWTDAPEATPRTEVSEAFPRLGHAQTPSTPKGPVATRREEEERNMRQHDGSRGFRSALILL